jgi:hypothetical protein
MNLNIYDLLKQNVENFSWKEEHNDSLPISEIELSLLISKLSIEIIAASETRPQLEIRFSKKLTLVEAGYLIACDKNPEATLSIIQQINDNEKKILNYVFKKLSPDFTQIQSNNLKELILLLGVNQIHDVAAKVISLNAQLDTNKEWEAKLNQLKNLRNTYDPSTLDNREQLLLFQINKQISMIEYLLACDKCFSDMV